MNILVYFIFIMLHKYTSLILFMIQHDCVPKAAGGVHIWAITAQKKKKNY